MSAVLGNRWERALAYQCLADKLPPFVQNYKFHVERKFEIDIAWPELKVGVEINGGIWNGKTGAHGSPLKILRDMEKNNALVMSGWRILRFTPKEANDGTALAGIKDLMGWA